MAEPLSLRCCCGHARRSHAPRWTWRLRPGQGLQRHAEAPGLCRYCACPGYFAPLAADARRREVAAGREPLELGVR